MRLLRIYCILLAVMALAMLNFPVWVVRNLSSFLHGKINYFMDFLLRIKE